MGQHVFLNLVQLLYVNVYFHLMKEMLSQYKSATSFSSP